VSPKKDSVIHNRENSKSSHRTNLRAKKSFIANITGIWCPRLWFNTSPVLDILGWLFVMLIKFLRENESGYVGKLTSLKDNFSYIP